MKLSINAFAVILLNFNKNFDKYPKNRLKFRFISIYPNWLDQIQHVNSKLLYRSSVFAIYSVIKNLIWNLCRKLSYIINIL